MGTLIIFLGIMLGIVFREVYITAIADNEESYFFLTNKHIKNKIWKCMVLLFVYIGGSVIIMIFIDPQDLKQAVSFGLFCSWDFFKKIILKGLDKSE